jgi:ribosomal protein S18 acetylase RimI-like enzyme
MQVSCKQENALIIFRATIDHLDQLADLYDQYRQFYQQKPDLEACRGFLGERIRNQESVIFAAQQDNGEIVGFTQLYNSYCSVEMEKLIYLYDLFVAPQARRQGAARALMDAARQYAVSCGAGRLQLETAVTNHPGQKLYEDLGWERDEEFYTYNLAP